MKKLTTLLAVFSISVNAEIENFDDINTLTDSGWIQENRSTPIGTTNWFQGEPSLFTAQDGTIFAYIAANFHNTGSIGQICNYLIMPAWASQTLSFWTRTTLVNGSSVIPDRLTVRYSPTGGVSTGDCINGYGDFTDELITINPDLSTLNYPNGYPLYLWQQIQVQIPQPYGRVAFIYDVSNAGTSTSYSNYIGLDTVQWTSDVIFKNSF